MTYAKTCDFQSVRPGDILVWDSPWGADAYFVISTVPRNQGPDEGHDYTLLVLTSKVTRHVKVGSIIVWWYLDDVPIHDHLSSIHEKREGAGAGVMRYDETTS